MLRRRIVLTIATGLIVAAAILAAWLFSQHPNTSSVQQPDNRRQESASGEHGTDAAPIVVRMARTRETEVEAANTAAYENEEARNNTLLMLFNGILALVAALELYYIIRQEKWMQKSVQAAQNSADAAMAANAASEAALKKSQRPWVVVDTIRIRDLRFDANNRYMLLTDVHFRNTGNSLATGVTAIVRLEVNLVTTLEKNWNKPEEDLRQRKEVVDRRTAWPLGIILAPGQSVPLPWGFGGPVGEGAPSPAQMMAGTFYLLGYVEYFDQFGECHHTRFAFNPTGDSITPWDRNTLVVSGGFQTAS